MKITKSLKTIRQSSLGTFKFRAYDTRNKKWVIMKSSSMDKLKEMYPHLDYVELSKDQ